MKLKILPPHLRNKKRYIAFEVTSSQPLIRDEVISLIWEGAIDFYGACGTSDLGLWVINVWKCDIPNKNLVKGMLRCNRKKVQEVRSIFPTITKFNGDRVVFHTLGISGTIKSAKKYIKAEY